MNHCLRRACVRLAWSVSLASSPVFAQQPGARVDSLFAAFNRTDSPGCAVGVYQSGKVVYAKGYGIADLEQGVPITPQTAFYIASTSKQFTAASIALLAQQGLLSLDDDVRKYVSELPDFGRPITIRHLIHHTSGLRDYLSLFGLTGGRTDSPFTEADFFDLIARQRTLNFSPGEQYSYSNTGYVLLAIIVKRASGKSLRDFAAERIFAPLGMSHTQFRDDHTLPIPRRAIGYTRRAAGDFRMSVPNFDMVGDGGMYSTVEDLARWDANFYDPRVGGPAFIELIHTRGVLSDGELTTYAFALDSSAYRGATTIRHGGAYGGYRSQLVRFPKQHFSVAVLCNIATANTDALAQRVADIYLDSALATVASGESAPAHSATSLTSGELSRFVGVYLNERTNVVRRIVLREGKLFYNRGGTNESELMPLGNDRFVMREQPPADVSFRAASDGPRMEVAGSGQRPNVFRGVRPADTVWARLASGAGTYSSEELGLVWKIGLRHGKLVLERPRSDVVVLEATFEDAFMDPNGNILLRYERDTGGRVTGLRVSLGERVRNIHFLKQAR
ncbi:MAG: serine hydrolase domain-containing protein [Gemmatimonadaceae bacterium]